MFDKLKVNKEEILLSLENLHETEIGVVIGKNLL